jgi:superfamily II DNA or RNA helicase
MILRPYQAEQVRGAVQLWRGGARRIAMVMATGGGKTPTAMTVAELSLSAGHPVLWLAHRTELIDQAIDKARMVAPGRRIGRLQGRDKAYRAELVVGSVQTASTPTSLALLKSRRWGLLVIDETHHIAAGTYQRVLRELGAFDPDGPLLLGVTATLGRGDRLSLGDTFEAVIEPQVGLLDLIRHPDGPYLVPPRGIRVAIAELNLDKVRRVAGDFNAGQLGAAMSDAMAPQRIVEAWEEHAKGRPTIAFLPTVAFSLEQAEAFRQAGYTAAHLDGTSTAEARRATLESYRRGEVDILCNVGLFDEGTDLPCTSCVIMGAPTSSTNRYQQQAGRGLRLHPGKRDCVIIDVVGNTKRHKLAAIVSLSGASSPEDMPDELLMYEVDDEAELQPEADEDDSQPGAGEDAPVVYADGELDHQLVDLFGRSHSAWLRTHGGVWFLPAPQGGIYLHARGGDRYDLRWFDGTSSGTIREDMEIGYAMAAGDEYAADRPLWQLGRDADWRKGGRGDRYDRKAVGLASRVLDKPTS